MLFHNISHFMQIWLLPPGIFLIFILLGFVLSYYPKNDYGISVSLVEKKSRNTLEESNEMAKILLKNNINTITHAQHMPRSLLAFKMEHVNVIPALMGFVLLKLHNSIINLLPSLEALNASTFAMHEYVGLVIYWIISKT